jgi:hypothetical protein
MKAKARRGIPPKTQQKKSYQTKNNITKDDQRHQQQRKTFRTKDAGSQPATKPDEQEHKNK